MRRRFIANLVVGFALLGLLHAPFVERNAAVVSMRDAVLSWQMAQLRGAVPFDAFAFIDVDDDAEAAWGMSPVTPRSQLAKLAAFALAGKPAALLIDFDLTWHRIDRPADDDALVRLLAAHQHTCETHCVPIFLVRDIVPTPRFSYTQAPMQMALGAVPSFLDKPLDTDPSAISVVRGISWGATDNEQDDDGMVRRWHLWMNSCARTGSATAVPSVALLAAAAATQTPFANVRDGLARVAARCVGRNSRTPQKAASVPDDPLRLGAATISLSNDRIERRIFYRLPWVDDADASNDGGQLLVLPAQKILANAAADPSLLRGRIVVLGSSSSIAGDSQATPIGMMPGSLVLINAMSTLIRGEQLHDVGLAGTIGVELLLIAIVSGLFAFLPAAAALPLSLLVVVIGALTVGFAALNSGVWIDSVLPAAGVIVHELAHRIQHYVHELKHPPYKHMR